MSRMLSERKVLKQLKIKDFRHLSKDTVMRFASSLQKMDPEVAKKALEQFPNFASAVKDGLAQYKEIAKEVIKSSDKDHDFLLEMIEKEQQILLEIVHDDDLTLDDKFRVIKKLDDLQDRVEKANKEMRLYRLKVGGLYTFFTGLSILAMAMVLGGDSEISNYDEEADDKVD